MYLNCEIKIPVVPGRINQIKKGKTTYIRYVRKRTYHADKKYNVPEQKVIGKRSEKGKQYDHSQPAVQVVQYCSRLFAIEDSINKKYPGDHQKRKQLRLEKEKPVLEALWSWLAQQKPQRNSRMDKAVTYAMNRRDTCRRVFFF